MKMLHAFHEVFDSQRMFRLLLDAMANPTRKVSIRECANRFLGNYGLFLALGMTLLDNEVSFSVCGDQALATELTSLTLARQEMPEQADYIFVPEASDAAQVIPLAKYGTLCDPHLSATLIVLDHGQEEMPITLHGAGIDGFAEVSISKEALAALDARDQQCYEYPQGIDLIFVSSEGELYAIPRLSHREVR